MIFKSHRLVRLALLLTLTLVAVAASAQQPFSAADLIEVRSVTDAVISPDGALIAGMVSRQRPASDHPGPGYSELVVWDVARDAARPFVSGKVSIREVQWSPDGRRISFLQKRGSDEYTQVWAIAVDGGEAVVLTKAATDVLDYRWHPAGASLAYIAETPPTEREKELKKKGFDFVFYEENLKHRNLYLQSLPGEGNRPEAVQLTDGVTGRAEWRPDGAVLALACSEQNLVDHEYMFHTDLTASIVKAPHGEDVLTRLPILGFLVAEEAFGRAWLRRIDRIQPHATLVHLSIAYTVAAPFFFFAWVLSGRAVFDEITAVLLGLALATTPLSFLTGVISWIVNYETRAARAFNLKFALGIALFLMLLGTSLWRRVGPEIVLSRPECYLYLAALVIQAVLAFAADFYGTKIVYS